MTMKKFNFFVAVAVLLFCAVQANAQVANTSVANNKDHVWKRHKTSMTFGYENQTMVMDGEEAKSNFGFALSIGHTFYLHKKPIAGIMKFGLDWSIVDYNVASFKEMDLSQAVSGEGMPDLGLMKMEIGTGIGPILTINPVDYLQIGAYFHATPSYSLLVNGSDIYGSYATYFNGGLKLAYKVITLGVEYRWAGDANYNRMISGEDIMGEGETDTPAGPESYLISAASTRFFLAFRFGGKKYKKS